MKTSASESKPFQSRSTVEIPGRTRRAERLSRSKLKEVFLIDSDAELIMYLIQCRGVATCTHGTHVRTWKSRGWKK